MILVIIVIMKKLILLIPFIDLSERPEHGQEGLVIRVRVDETTEAASTRYQAVGVCDRDRWVGIGLMHDDVLLISFTIKPHIQNANVFPEDRN